MESRENVTDRREHFFVRGVELSGGCRVSACMFSQFRFGVGWAWGGDDPGARSAAALHQTGSFQFAVCPDHRVVGYAEVRGQLSHGRQSVALL